MANCVYRISSAVRSHGNYIREQLQASKQSCPRHGYDYSLGSCVCVCVCSFKYVYVRVCMCFDTELTLVYNLISLCN